MVSQEGAFPVDGLKGDREEVKEEVGGALEGRERKLLRIFFEKVV